MDCDAQINDNHQMLSLGKKKTSQVCYVIFTLKLNLVVYTIDLVNIHKIMLGIRIKQHMVYCRRID
jgi:hypothetical protein